MAKWQKWQKMAKNGKKWQKMAKIHYIAKKYIADVKNQGTDTWNWKNGSRNQFF
jgi:hypothetical protein